MKGKSSTFVQKLPQWAQAEISRLGKDVAYWKAKAYQATGETPSDVHLVTYDIVDNGAGGNTMAPNKPLPVGSCVRFTLGGSRHQDVVYVDVRIKDGELDINANDQIAVVPVAVNVVRVRAKDPVD